MIGQDGKRQQEKRGENDQDFQHERDEGATKRAWGGHRRFHKLGRTLIRVSRAVTEASAGATVSNRMIRLPAVVLSTPRRIVEAMWRGHWTLRAKLD